jgi:hypothetical protein
MDPDPDSKSGSGYGSTALMESGSETLFKIETCLGQTAMNSAMVRWKFGSGSGSASKWNLEPDRHHYDADPQHNIAQDNHFHVTVPLIETCLGQTAMNSAMVRCGESPGFTRSKNSRA